MTTGTFLARGVSSLVVRKMTKGDKRKIECFNKRGRTFFKGTSPTVTYDKRGCRMTTGTFLARGVSSLVV